MYFGLMNLGQIVIFLFFISCTKSLTSEKVTENEGVEKILTIDIL